jgi:DNA-binding HxlR family transcriptional regulator
MNRIDHLTIPSDAAAPDIVSSKTKGPRRKTGAYFCTIEVALDCIGGKWKPSIMYHLKGGPLRFTELLRRVPQASRKVLTEQLRQLQQSGLIQRSELPDEVPKGTLYALTEEAMALSPILQSLHEWGRAYATRRGIELAIDAPEQTRNGAKGELNQTFQPKEQP